ncbi:MAG: exodeoxyribonuclease VII large subunit [Actinomycetota bacterium]|nr:MAG: exodeoxyribonuclease VII large subunit [Actinomycetota bacterium]
MALATSPEQPAPVRTIARLVSDWVDRLGAVWIEGQVAQLTRRPGARTVWLTLRDTDADMSLQVVAGLLVAGSVTPPLAEGQRVVVQAKPEFWTGRGQLQLRATEIRPVGLGALLAQIEQLKAVLAAEGLFSSDRKRPIPFLPRSIGLVSGRNSAALRDVVANARQRWPAARFEVREVVVQGPQSVPAIVAALRELDTLAAVEVIVVARGGGSVEDLLPFSNETLVRAVAACQTPVVSAIGHEQDSPLLDLVADLRASTPTDAGRRVVPDVAEERRRIDDLARRASARTRGRLDAEQRWLQSTVERAVLAEPGTILQGHRHLLDQLTARAVTTLRHRLHRAEDDLTHVTARVRALSPAATLERGYAVVRRADGTVVRSAASVEADELLRIRLADGELTARPDAR